MFPYAKRNYSRNNYKAHILYADYETDNYIDAKMFNYSHNGMYFEIDRDLKPGTDIYIEMVNYLPDEPGPEAYKAYKASVRWRRKTQKQGALRYGVGIEYLDKSHIVFADKIYKITCSCDLCGANKPSREICKEDDCVCLCHNCYRYLNGLPDGTTKASIKRILVGNVI